MRKNTHALKDKQVLLQEINSYHSRIMCLRAARG